MEEADEPRPHRRAAWLIVSVLVVVFVLYPLSVGPAEVLGDFAGCDRAIYAVYWPLFQLCYVTNTQELATAYINFWADVLGADWTLENDHGPPALPF